MPLSSNFFAESTGKKRKIGQYVAMIWTNCNSLVFLVGWGTRYITASHHVGLNSRFSSVSVLPLLFVRNCACNFRQGALQPSIRLRRRFDLM